MSEFRENQAELITQQAKISIIPGNVEANDAYAKSEEQLEDEDEKLKKINELEKQRLELVRPLNEQVNLLTLFILPFALSLD